MHFQYCLILYNQMVLQLFLLGNLSIFHFHGIDYLSNSRYKLHSHFNHKAAHTLPLYLAQILNLDKYSRPHIIRRVLYCM